MSLKIRKQTTNTTYLCIFPYFHHFLPISSLFPSQSCQNVTGGHPSPLLSTGDATPGVLGPVLASSFQERHGHTEGSPTKDHTDDQGTGASLRGKAKTVESVQSGAENTQEGSHQYV